ncbi:uncharacterized protein L199_002830 [Kwoniella botswanensis]|uniref:uncharacterized protein n=1 Tax=Kwoniella botswanensis TaxID=1268659 RepID=UPI00315D477F
MLLYLVRHGQTEQNQRGIVQGRLDTPLSDLGREQAKKLSDWLKLVPFTEIWSSPLKRAEETARIICSQQPKAKLRIDERLETRGAGDAQGKPWDEVKDIFESLNPESEAALSARLHDWLSVLLSTHTPSASGAATPVSPLTPSSNNGPVLERALSSIKGLARPGIPRIGSVQTNTLSWGVVLVVTHQECLTCLLDMLTCPAPSTTNDEMMKKSPIDLHVPEHVKFNSADPDRQVGNTSVAIIRVWWEDDATEGNELVPRGRLEAWGSEEHLQVDE